MFIPFRMNFIHPFGGDHPVSEATMVCSDLIFPLHPLNIPHEGFTYAVLLLPRNMGWICGEEQGTRDEHVFEITMLGPIKNPKIPCQTERLNHWYRKSWFLWLFESPRKCSPKKSVKSKTDQFHRDSRDSLLPRVSPTNSQGKTNLRHCVVGLSVLGRFVVYVGWSWMILDAYDWKILNPESRSILTTAHAHLIQSFGSQVSPWCLINRYTKGEECFQNGVAICKGGFK